MVGKQYPRTKEMLVFFEGMIEYSGFTAKERNKKRATVILYRSVVEKEIIIKGNDLNQLNRSTGVRRGDKLYEPTNPKIEGMMKIHA